MSDDLEDVKADLKRIGDEEGDVLCRAALREIEALEADLAAENARADALAEKLAKAVEALEVYADGCDAPDTGDCGYEGNLCCRASRDALAAIQETTDD